MWQGKVIWYFYSRPDFTNETSHRDIDGGGNNEWGREVQDNFER
jgi:hypothetical protein